jgi:hypothetical protein
MTLYTLSIPSKLNGDQLQAEIGAFSVRVVGNTLIIDSDKSEAEVLTAVSAHVPLPHVEPNVDEKLASVGVSLDDLKAALGI